MSNTKEGNAGDIVIENNVIKCGGENPGEIQEDCGGVKALTLPEGRPRKLKNGSFKWGDKRFASEEELNAFIWEIAKVIPCDTEEDGDSDCGGLESW